MIPAKARISKSQEYPEYFEIFAMLHRPVESDLDGEYESKMVQLSTLNNGRPLRPQIEAMVATGFGSQGWKLWHWWMPEPEEF